jgi:hypothetical protein
MRPALSRLLGGVVAGLLLLAPAGCGTTEEPDLLNDLAARLDRAGDLTFTAEYRLTGGATVTIAQSQNPRRAAYLYPGGTLIATPAQTADCRPASATSPAGARTRCVLTPPPSTSTDPVLDLLASAAAQDLPGTGAGTGAGAGASPSPNRAGTGLVTPSAAMRLVSSAVLDGATITRHDATIAGEPATCVGVHGPGGFTACITARGLLGSFTGTVDGMAVECELTKFDQTVEEATFALPPGATVDDRRPGR